MKLYKVKLHEWIDMYFVATSFDDLLRCIKEAIENDALDDLLSIELLTDEVHMSRNLPLPEKDNERIS